MNDAPPTSNMPEKLDLTTPDGVARNIDRLAEIFPGCLTETRDPETGELRRGIDLDALRQELSDHVVEGGEERYRLDWPGKRAATLAANAPIDKTLRPVREESVNFDTAQNLFIEGDNLDALKLLQETYLGKVKMIFIDPPYNTGKDFIYDDDFAEDADTYLKRSGQRAEDGAGLVANPESNGRYHSDWLSMMWPRLKLARNLLRDDGAIFIAIDDHEVANLRKICDEVFGAQNFIANLVWQKKYTRSNDARYFSDNHDHILCYGRLASSLVLGSLPRTEKQLGAYSNPDLHSKGAWKATPLHAKSGTNKEKFYFPNNVLWQPPTGTFRRFNDAAMRELYDGDEIWFGESGNQIPSRKSFLAEVKDGVTPVTIWPYDEVGHNHEASNELKQLGLAGKFRTPKPTRLIRRCIALTTSLSGSDLIVDFFSGSASTAHAVLLQNAEDGGNRRFLAVQIDEPLLEKEAGLETIFDVGITRVRNVIAELEMSSKAASSSQALIGFRVLKVATSSFKKVHHYPGSTLQASLLTAVNNIQEDRTDEDLLFQVLLAWGVDLGLGVGLEELVGCRTFFVDRDALAACFAVNLTDAYVKALAARAPLRAVFRDGAFGNDAGQINVVQLFRQISPYTEVKFL